MIYLDNGATSFHKPPQVARAVLRALRTCANPGRGGYGPAMEAQRQVFSCREEAAKLFSCRPEQVVTTMNCTHGLNLAIRSLLRPGMKAVISGFEHNAVLRPLHALGAEIWVAGRRLFDPEDTLREFRRALDMGAELAVCTHVSNVFGYILPVEQIGALCRERGIPFIVDAAQSAGTVPVSLEALGADFIAMPGHKALLGPQGTGLLLCREGGEPLIFGGTGSASAERTMPAELPERLESGTQNVPGLAGLTEGLRFLRRRDMAASLERERRCGEAAARLLEAKGWRVFRGAYQTGTVSFLPDRDPERLADLLGSRGIALRAGLHCAPLAHESAGTLDTGTVRISFGWDASPSQVEALGRALRGI